MAGLTAPTAPVLSKSSGNVQGNINNLRAMKVPVATESALMGDDLQRQVDAIVNALKNPGALTQLSVLDTKGALIGWIGTQIVGNVTYEGGWFEDLYIGGTGPADAVIVATAGGVTINGASIKLTSNGLETDINNETLPVWGSGVSLVSIDTSVPHGDQSFIAPNAMGVFAWDGVSALVPAALLGEGIIQLSSPTSADQITLGVGPATITITDGIVTTVIGPSGIVTPLINAAAYDVSGVPGINLTTNVLTAASITAGTLNFGSSLTVNTSATGVFGTPGAGQSNGTVVTGVSLNISSTGIVTAASVTSVGHQWSKGILTS